MDGASGDTISSLAANILKLADNLPSEDPKLDETLKIIQLKQEIEDERAIRTARHTIDLVDLRCGLLVRQRHFEADWHLQFLSHTATTCVLHPGPLA